METAEMNTTKVKMQRYPAYKDSGEEWFENIPEQWAIKPGFTIVSERNEKNIGLKENQVLSLSYGSIVIKPEEKLTGLVPASFETYQIVYPGDIIIRTMDLQNDKTSLRIGFANDKGIISSAYLNLKVRKGYYAKYYYYFLHNIDISKIIYGLGSGLRQNLSYLDFKRFYFLVPPLDEQTRIAEFLDRKTAQVDQAIAQKERQIELLKERRQILIHNAVTRGLNPNVKMKYSGVEWIGEIPEHWEVRQLRRVFDFLNPQRIPLSAEEREKMPGGYPYYGASGIIDYVNDYIFDEPLILIAEDGANLLSKSTPLAFVAKGKYWVNNHAHIIRPIFEGFVYWAELLSAVDYTTSISGAAQPKLTMDRLKSIKLPVPPPDELIAISLYIESRSGRFAIATSAKQQEIEKLKEYKATLINAAVTGKIKV